MPRFVVLRHEPSELGGKPLHWDLMLEWINNKLRTWSLDEEPHSGLVIGAHQLADHRLEYLTYEGEISGNRGSVQRWDAGTYELIRDEKDLVAVRLEGERINGIASLERSGPEHQRWNVSFPAGS